MLCGRKACGRSRRGGGWAPTPGPIPWEEVGEGREEDERKEEGWRREDEEQGSRIRARRLRREAGHRMGDGRREGAPAGEDRSCISLEGGAHRKGGRKENPRNEDGHKGAAPGEDHPRREDGRMADARMEGVRRSRVLVVGGSKTWWLWKD